jgi:hypothetical protein
MLLLALSISKIKLSAILSQDCVKKKNFQVL